MASYKTALFCVHCRCWTRRPRCSSSRCGVYWFTRRRQRKPGSSSERLAITTTATTTTHAKRYPGIRALLPLHPRPAAEHRDCPVLPRWPRSDLLVPACHSCGVRHAVWRRASRRAGVMLYINVRCVEWVSGTACVHSNNNNTLCIAAPNLSPSHKTHTKRQTRLMPLCRDRWRWQVA